MRTMRRLALYGLAASPFFMGLGSLVNGWWPLNIMFMLLVACLMLYLADQGGSANTWAAALVFIVGGAYVEFWWFALAFCYGAWWYCKSPSTTALIAWTLACASLYAVNHNFWALAAMPIILAAPLVKLQMPRWRHAFYVYYPAHLATLLLISSILERHVLLRR